MSTQNEGLTVIRRITKQAAVVKGKMNGANAPPYDSRRLFCFVADKTGKPQMCLSVFVRLVKIHNWQGLGKVEVLCQMAMPPLLRNPQ